MISEFLQSLTTLCPAPWRRMGYLKQAIGINARYARQKRAWQNHINASQNFIQNTAKLCTRRRKVIVMGAASVHDIPVRALSDLFEEVILVDLFHLWQSRWLATRLPNVRLEVCDLTASLDAAFAGSPDISTPTAYLEDDNIDLVISCNIASQLPLIPLDWLNHIDVLTPEQQQQYGQDMIANHFDYLAKFKGQVCLMTDRERITFDRQGQEIKKKHALFELPPPVHQAEWQWDITPLGEIHKAQATSHIVIAAVLGQNSKT